MSATALKVPENVSYWTVEFSHLVNVPESYEATSLKELRSHVQLTADRKSTQPGGRAIGEVGFRYEADDNDEVTVLHCFFTNKHLKKVRFMRLRREET